MARDLPLLTPGPEAPGGARTPAPGAPRRDAARNHEALLAAAGRLVARDGVCAVTTEAVAAEAGVGKGTVFRHFESRAGLMAALLDHSETAWQAAVISGPPPLGPGADPWERLVAFGRSRIEVTLRHADLIRAAGHAGVRNFAPYAFAAMHVRLLLRDLGVDGDLPLLATALLAPLEIPVLDQQVGVEHLDVERITAGWIDLAGRVCRR